MGMFCSICCTCIGSSIVVKHQANRSDINDHPHHDMPGSYMCTVGDKQFTSNTGMNHHERRLTHVSDKQFLCTVCDKQLITF